MLFQLSLVVLQSVAPILAHPTLKDWVSDLVKNISMKVDCEVWCTNSNDFIQLFDLKKPLRPVIWEIISSQVTCSLLYSSAMSFSSPVASTSKQDPKAPEESLERLLRDEPKPSKCGRKIVLLFQRIMKSYRMVR